MEGRYRTRGSPHRSTPRCYGPSLEWFCIMARRTNDCHSSQIFPTACLIHRPPAPAPTLNPRIQSLKDRNVEATFSSR